jgi:hypothetical protein
LRARPDLNGSVFLVVSNKALGFHERVTDVRDVELSLDCDVGLFEAFLNVASHQLELVRDICPGNGFECC